MQVASAPQRLDPNHSLHPWTRFCLFLLILAAAEFAVRGPMRAIRFGLHYNDFLSPYIQGKALAHRQDPYSSETLLRLWPADAPNFTFLPKEEANGTLVANRGFPTAYPVTALVLLAPLSLLPWSIASPLWFGANLLLFVTMLRALLGLAGLSWREPKGILLIASALALAPFHTCIAAGNPTAIVVELSVIGLWQARQDWIVMAAILFALSAGLKPQIGLVFLFYYLLRRHWRLIVTATILLALVCGAGILWLAITHTPWLENYLRDNRILLETGILGNFTAINPIRFGLINLQVALYPLTSSVESTNLAARVTGIILLICWLFGFARTKNHEDCETLELGALAVISLLPIYHRFYDASLLALVLCWAFVSRGKTCKLAIAALFLMTPFLLPGGTILETLQVGGHIPASLVNHAWWQVFVMAHQVWALLLLSFLLLGAMFSQRHLAGQKPDALG